MSGAGREPVSAFDALIDGAKKVAAQEKSAADAMKRLEEVRVAERRRAAAERRERLRLAFEAAQRDPPASTPEQEDDVFRGCAACGMG